MQCCAEARRRRRASAQHCTGMTNWPNTIQCLGSDDIMSLGIKSSAFLRVEHPFSRESRIPKIPKIQILEIKICVAQNVGKVWISRKKTAPGPIWGHPWPFFAWAGKSKNIGNLAYFPWWANGPYSPGLGKWLQYFFCHP